MKLSSILKGCEFKIFSSFDIDKIEIQNIEYDSRKIKQGGLFVAITGNNYDGKEFIPDALKSGAVAVVTDKFYQNKDEVLILVPDIRKALAILSSNFYNEPDKKLFMIGITGTNGKTTTTYILENIFNLKEKQAGVIGTINYRYANFSIPAKNTTPESLDIFNILNNMINYNQKIVIMEVSSHALSFNRVSEIEFDIAIFTNLSRDHLDFHKDMDSYFQAKSTLFTNLLKGKKNYTKYAIINNDDIWGQKLLNIVKNVKTISYGINRDAEFRAKNILTTNENTEFLLVTPKGSKKVCIPYLGIYNIYNTLAAVAAAFVSGVELEDIIKGIENAPQVPGRLERIILGQEYTVLVDYAHTDDALKNVLGLLRSLNPNRLITVFGCGGDRDRSKRPIMGAIATEMSDFVFITSDNPRTEDPQKIILDIEVGIKRSHRNNYQIIVDREQAISAAINMAQKKDIILLAGKGHENYQIIGKEVLPFNDAEIAKRYIIKRLKYNNN